MVGDQDAVHPGVDGLPCVVGVQDPFQDDRQRRPLAQPGNVRPVERGTRVGLQEGLHRLPGHRRAKVGQHAAGGVLRHRHQGLDRADRHLGLGTGYGRSDTSSHHVDEAGIRGVLVDAHPLRERQRAQVQVLRPPAQHGGVERDHDGRRTALLGALQEAVHQLLVTRPVELVPAGRPGRHLVHRRGSALHRCAGLAGEDVRDTEFGGGPADVDVGLRKDQAARTHRGEQDRCRQLLSEQLRGHTPYRDVAQHPGDDRPAVEGAAVGPHGAAFTRSTGDIGPRLGGHLALGSAFQIVEVGGYLGLSPKDAVGVDLVLSSPAGKIGRRSLVAAHRPTVAGQMSDDGDLSCLTSGSSRNSTVALGC